MLLEAQYNNWAEWSVLECGLRSYSSLAGDRRPEADSKRAGRRPSVLIPAPHI